MSPTPEADDLLAALLADLEARGATVAVAESLTGGLLALRFTQTPGASTVFAGGIVTYHTAAKRRLLAVPDGPVISDACAQAMADGVARLFDADYALATTGVAGPETQEGRPVGTVHLGWHARGRSSSEAHQFDDRGPDEVRAASVATAIELLASLIDSRDDAASIGSSVA